MKQSKTLNRLFSEWRQQSRSFDTPWEDVQNLRSEEIDQITNVALVPNYAADPEAYDDKEAALSFLAMIQNEAAFETLQKCLSSKDLWTSVKAAAAVAVFWPDIRFEPAIRALLRKAKLDVSLEHTLRIQCGLALYRIGKLEGLEILFEQAKNFDTSYDSQNYHDRVVAARLIAKYLGSKELDKLPSLLGEGVYAYISDRLVKDSTDALISKLTNEMKREPWGAPYIAFTLCRMGDSVGFERTKEVFLNYERFNILDNALNWSLSALARIPWSGTNGEGQYYSPEQVCPVLLEFIQRRTSTDSGGDAHAIESVIYAFSSYFTPEVEREFNRLRHYTETNTNWSKDNRKRIILAISSVEKRIEK